MTLQKSSHNFTAMFRESMRKSCVMPILLFAVLFIYSIINAFEVFSNKVHGATIQTNAMFFDSWRERDASLLMNAFLIFTAVITAIAVFRFSWSKKQCNVIYSLGMSRNAIFFSRLLGGIVPMAGAVTAASLIEVFANIFVGSTINGHFWLMVAYTTLQWIAVYALAFILCAVVFSNCGNVVEALVFTAVLSLFTMAVSTLLDNTMTAYTLGAGECGLTGEWNWSSPFVMNEVFRDFNSVKLYAQYEYFSNPPQYTLSVFDFSGIIMSVIYGVILTVIGSIAAKNRKNEIAGTWGRAKLLTEIVSAVVGMYAFTVMLGIMEISSMSGNGTFGTFLLCCVAFLVSSILFRLIFSYGRKKALLVTLKHFPAYSALLGVFTLAFALGCFGFSSYIPDAEKIKSVSVSSAILKGNDEMLVSDSFYGLKNDWIIFSSDYLNDSDIIAFTNANEINEVTKVHKAIIDDGKIKNGASDACGAMFCIKYNLTNGKTVYREYNETTFTTAKKMMSLGDSSAHKKNLERKFFYISEKNHVNRLIEKYISDTLGLDVIVYDYDEKVFDKDGHELGWISYDYEDGTYLFNSVNGTDFAIEGVSLDSEYDSNMQYLLTDNCYLYPTDMTKGYSIGVIDKELYNALQKDFINISADDYFSHKPEDEIGILSFGLSYTNCIDIDEYYDESYTGSDIDNDAVELSGERHIVTEKGKYAENISWNLNSSDIKTFVVTKQMYNTVKYLENHDLLKYFDSSRNVGDIKSVKLATQEELYGKTNLSKKYPVFYACYWSEQTVKLFNDEGYENDHLFKRISKEITDVEKITKLIDGSLVFGAFDKDYRIMEITYKDGSIATVLVPYETYKSVLG